MKYVVEWRERVDADKYRGWNGVTRELATEREVKQLIDELKTRDVKDVSVSSKETT